MESLEEVCLAKFSPFLIEKVISTRASPKTVKKTRNGNLLVEVDNRRQAENILKIKTFHTTKCRPYPHEKLNTSKGVIRSKELALATEDEIASAMGKQGVTNIKRISSRKGEERIQTNTYILIFNKPQTPKEVKISYCLGRIEQYVPAPLRCFRCQKFGHHRGACRGRQTCSKCDEKDPDHAEEDCLKEIRYTNCQQDHPAYARTCTVYQKEKEIIEVKHKRNVSFLEARRIVGSYMGESSYAYVARRADRINDDTKYRTLVEKLLKLKANDWPKFQKHLKKLHSDEFYQAPAQQQVPNGERSNVVVQTKTHVGSITPTRTTPKSAKSPSKQPLHKSPIGPPKSIKDRLKNLSPLSEQLKQKSQFPISQTTKIQMNTKVNKERPGSTFKIPSTTKSPITTEASNSQPPKKNACKGRIESMDSDTDRLVASLNLEEIIKNYNTWNHLNCWQTYKLSHFFELLISNISYVSIQMCANEWLKWNSYCYIETLVII